MAPAKKFIKNATLENVDLIFRNFSGEARKFNPAGQRNFCIKLPDDIAEQMTRDGWTTIKHLAPKEEGDTEQAFIKVKVNYASGRPPRATLVTSRNKTMLGEREVDMLDVAEAKQVDVIITPYRREDPDTGEVTVSAYLKSIYFILEEDELDIKYAGVPDTIERRDRVEGPNFGDEPAF
jgi:hypothetical protein